MENIGRFVRLDRVLPEDVPVLFRLAVADDLLWRWHGYQRNFESFQGTLWADTIETFIVRRLNDPAVIGLASLYGANFQNGYCYALYGLVPDERGAGVFGEGAALLFDFAFSTYSFRKVYAEATEARRRAYEAFSDRLLKVEGCLREHVFADGAYQDVYLMALRRDAWLDWRRRLAGLRDDSS